MILAEIFAGKSVTLLGAGISNMPLARAVAPICASLTVRDRKTPEQLGETAEELTALGVKLITGEDYLADITEDLVFRSPGIRPDLPELEEARARGCAVTSEMELFLSVCPCPVYAVTGSDGKTTTTTLTSMLLTPEGDGRVLLGGNIGEPLLYRLEKVRECDVVAVELSSFQLMTVDAPLAVAAITNITPNHLNWHTSMDEYISAKRNVLKHCGRAVLNYDNDVTREIALEMQKTAVPVTFFSLSPLPSGLLRDIDSAVWFEDGGIYTLFPDEGTVKVLERSGIRLPGMHNVANYMTAIAVTHGMCSAEKLCNVAAEFGGVEHRLEFVREKDGVSYINGSIDSSPTRTAAALSALEDRSVVLIAGGSDKHISYAPLAESVFSSSVRAAVLTGETMEKIAVELEKHPKYDEKIREGFILIREPDFDTAVKTASAIAKPGDTVILSPASASFDRFKNFEQRGRHYKDIVMGL